MKRVATHLGGWLAAACLLAGCSSGESPFGGVTTVAAGTASNGTTPADTDTGDDDDGGGKSDDPGDGPGLPEGDCNPGATAACYGGPEGTAGLGICLAGMAECGADGRWGECEGWTAPVAETCNGLDDDCNGVPDDASAECSTGLAGPCAMGTSRCDDGAMTCVPSVQPAAGETCGDNVDNDCNGQVDDGCDTGGTTGGGGPGPGGGGNPPGVCDPLNPGPVCGPAAHCFANPNGIPHCAGPTGFGTQYANCVTDADCVPNHICVNTQPTTSYCMQWCTSPAQCLFAGDSCRPLNPRSFVGAQEYGVCWDGQP